MVVYAQMKPTAESSWFMLMENWQLPGDMAAVEDYISRVRSRNSWAGTGPSMDRIIKHW